jgi:hypothetical protein
MGLASQYALEIVMVRAKAIESALADRSWVRWWQPFDLVAVPVDFLRYCYDQGW